MTRNNRAIVSEGYFDAIACHLAGFTEAVATLGTALSEEHAQLLHRLTERVYLVFDADSAGINAALRSQAIFRQAGADVRIVRLPAGHDPGYPAARGRGWTPSNAAWPRRFHRSNSNWSG